MMLIISYRYFASHYHDGDGKRYSSGMTVRLGFAIAAHLEPEILVVDEVLAVGDAEFQKKAIGKMQDVSKGEGRTVLFVSHNMASINALCKTGLLLENGSIKYSGSIKDTVSVYLTETINKSTKILERTDRRGNQMAKVIAFEINTKSNLNADNILMGESCDFKINIRSV